MPTQAFGFNTPFQAQIDHLRQKLDLPTDKWDAIVGRAHDRAFVVAGAAKADLLADLHAQINLRAQDGAGLNAFRKDFKAIVAKHGWTGWTGEGTKEGEAWRTRVIYQTNMASSYAAGRHAQMSDPEVLKLHPYWRYIHSEGAMHPRPLHLSWHGLTLPHDHPFFQTHFAPNGWNCFPAETVVRCDARLGLKTWYAGEMVEFSTAGGNRLAVTANHPILTRRGWVCAHQLNKGDQLIGAVGDVDTLLVGVVDGEQAPTSAEYLFESLAAQGLRVAPMAPNDFHGDAILRKAEIHIAGSDGALVDVAKAARGEFIGESGLKLGLHRRVEPPFIAIGSAQTAPIKSNAILTQDAAYRGLGNAQARSDLGLTGESATVQGENLSLDSGVARISDDPCRAQLALNAAWRALDRLPAQSFGFGSPAQGDALSEKDAPQSIAAAAGLFGELLEANPTAVTLDEINEIRKYQWVGHVYDFVTTTGLILAGGIIVSNCQCRITSVTRKEGEASARAGLGEPPADWQAINPKTGAPVGIDKGFDYAPGASSDVALRQLVQDKLITYPPAISKALSHEVNRYINATERASEFAARMLVNRANAEPLWIGFVENPQSVTDLVGRDVKGYTLLIPSDAPRHIDTSHAYDGGTQRAPVAADFDRVALVLNDADSLQAGDLSRNKNPRVVAVKAIDGEIYRAVFEVLSGKKGTRSLSLVSLLIKAAT